MYDIRTDVKFAKLFIIRGAWLVKLSAMWWNIVVCLWSISSIQFHSIWPHVLSYVLVQVTMNVPLIRVKLLRAINGNPDLYSYSYSCLCERSAALGKRRDVSLCSWQRGQLHFWLNTYNIKGDDWGAHGQHVYQLGSRKPSWKASEHMVLWLTVTALFQQFKHWQRGK